MAGFTWPVLRRDARGASGSFLTGASLTGLGAALLSGPLTRLYRVEHDLAPIRAAVLHEVVTFVTPAGPMPQVRATARETTATRVRTLLAGPRVDQQLDSSGLSSDAPAAPRRNSATADAIQRASSSSTADGPTPRNTTSFVVLPPAGFRPSAPLNASQRDSVLYQLSSAVPRLAATRRPTQAERDSLWRDEARRQAMWRDQGRPIPLTFGDGGFSLPLFASGPSREQRMRDSVVHHDNLLRLERIAERARTKADTARAVAERRETPKVVTP